MKPTRCPNCQSEYLCQGPLTGRSEVRFGVGFWWAGTPVQAITCLDCGVVTPFLDNAALTKLRARNGYHVQEEKKASLDEL